MDKTLLMSAIRTQFAFFAESGISFHDSILQLVPLINLWAKGFNADNWQLLFDLLYWDWCQSPERESIHPEELDKLALTISPFSDQKRVINQQIVSADEWAKDLQESGLSPLEALSLAKEQCVQIVEEVKEKKQIATHPSAIAIPQKIVELYRNFYRASKKYNIESTDAIRPLIVAKETIVKSQSIGEDLIQEVAGALGAKLSQIRRGTAKGRWVLPNVEDERAAILEFASFLVVNVLGERFGGDRAAFSAKRGIGLIEDACVFLYALKQDAENNSN